MTVKELLDVIDKRNINEFYLDGKRTSLYQLVEESHDASITSVIIETSYKQVRPADVQIILDTEDATIIEQLSKSEIIVPTNSQTIIIKLKINTRGGVLL